MKNNVLFKPFSLHYRSMKIFFALLLYNEKKSFPISSSYFSSLSVTNWIFYNIILIPTIDLIISQLIINQIITMFPIMIALVLFGFQYWVMWILYFLCKSRFF